MLSLEEWKPIAQAEYPTATGDDIKKYFDSATSDDQMDFT